MSVSAIESAATWLGKQLVEEILFLVEVKDKVEELKQELEWIRCFLEVVDKQQNKNALVRKCVSEIRDLGQEAEDVIDVYIMRVSNNARKTTHHRFPCADLKWLIRCWPWRDAKALHGVGRDIATFTNKIKILNTRLDTYGVRSSFNNISGEHSHVPSQGGLIEQRRTYSHFEDEVVGLNKRADEIADKLVTEKQNVVVIHGMGGIGKTTLARKVYHNVHSQFKRFAWAYVSQQLQLGSVCKDILDQLTGDDKEQKEVSELRESQLPTRLHKMLKETKCLVVLDDIWFARDWDRLKHAFPIKESSCDSKLLVTTRDRHIFTGLLPHEVCYCEAELLNHDTSWELFQKKAYFNKHSAEPSMVDMGEQFLRHCNGHPLAIVVLGGVLAAKTTYEEWQSVYENLPLHLGGQESYEGVYEVLAMSYYELPYHLKPCFLILGCFPADFYIQVERLYHLWIAEGFLSSAQDPASVSRSLEDIAKVYLNDLVQKGMVQVFERHSDGNIATCKLHDLMRDKCLEIVKKENFLHVIDHIVGVDDRLPRQTPSSYAVNEKHRRLSILWGHQHAIDTSLLINSSSSKNVLPLRSLVFFRTSETRREDCELIRNVSKDCPLLRILDLTNMPLFGKLPSDIGTLIYLRYLSLRGTNVTELPYEIGSLRSLLILDLRVTGVVIKLPNVLWKMRSLKQLYFPCRAFYLESSEQGYEIVDGENLILDKLDNIEMIEDVDLDRVDVKGLLNLTSMRKLGASCVHSKESLDPFLKSSSIKSVSLKIRAPILVEHPGTLSGCNFLHFLHIDDDQHRRTPLPKTMLEKFPQYLVELTFWYCQISADFMPVLERLPRLKRLELHLCYRRRELHFSNGGFPELTYLILDGLFSLREWTVGKDCLPKLNKIEIHNCPIRMLSDALPPQVVIHCFPCANGIERYGTCPNALVEAS